MQKKCTRHLKKIELNLSENIASSTQINMGYYFLVTLFGCTIQYTGKKISEVTEAEAETCKINYNAKIGGGRIVSEDEARPYFKR